MHYHDTNIVLFFLHFQKLDLVSIHYLFNEQNVCSD